MYSLKNLFIYSGLEKESYQNVKPVVRAENRKNLIAFSSIGFFGFTASLAVGAFSSFGMSNTILIVLCVVFACILVLALTVAKRVKTIINWMCYFVTAFLLAVGVYAGASQSNERTTLLLPFFIFSAVMFYERLCIIISEIVVAEIVYLILIVNTYNGSVYITNVTNSSIFCVVGVFTAVYIMRMKYRKLDAEYKNRKLIEIDTLTSTFNRHCYEIELLKVKEKKVPVAICSFDINGLKDVNDSLGHSAGDELIVGAAECITEIFGKHGKIFRTGGDEFMAILDTDIDNTEELHQAFINKQSRWSGKEVKKINISCGIALLDRDYEKKLEEALREADRLMYAEKRKYYEQSGIERRKG